MPKPAQLDFFKYPRAPGFKKRETAARAALAMVPRALSLRQAALEILRTGTFTADEVAAKLDKSILAIRPRLSELAATNQIFDTGARRQNDSGHKAIVWKATNEED